MTTPLQPDEHSRSSARIIDDTLRGLPLADRQSALACSIMEGNPRALNAVAAMVSFATVMAAMLTPTQRAAFAAHLRSEAQAIESAWQ
jgi:hypothetical protein